MTKDLIKRIANSIPLSKFVDMVTERKYRELPSHMVYGVYQHSIGKIVYVGQANPGLGQRWVRRARVVLNKSTARSNLEKYLHNSDINDFSVVTLYKAKGNGKLSDYKDILNTIEKYYGNLFDVKKLGIAERLPKVKPYSPNKLKAKHGAIAAACTSAGVAVVAGAVYGVKKYGIPFIKYTAKNWIKFIRI